VAEQPVDEHPQGNDPAAELTPRVTERLAAVDTRAAADRGAAERADHAARQGPLRPADVHAHLDGAPGPDGQASLVVASATATGTRSRRRTGLRGGRCLGCFLLPTGFLDTAPDETARVRRRPRPGPRPRGAERHRPDRAFSATVTRSTPDATAPRTSGTRRSPRTGTSSVGGR
jgi:hypothetical protein